MEMILWVLLGMCSGFIAKEKGYHALTWVALGALGGIFALITIAMLPDKNKAKEY